MIRPLLPLGLALLALSLPARASELSMSLDGNFFDTTPGDDSSTSLGARVGGHAALDLTLFSSQVDWRIAGSVHPLPSSDSHSMLYMGPQLRLSPHTDTAYLGVGFGAGASTTLWNQGVSGRLLSVLFPVKITTWGGYRFAEPNTNSTQSVEGYGTVGADGLTLGLRWGLTLR